MPALITAVSILGYIAGWMVCVRVFERNDPSRNENEQVNTALSAFLWPLWMVFAAFYGLYRVASLPPKRERVQAKIDRLTKEIDQLTEEQDR